MTQSADPLNNNINSQDASDTPVLGDEALSSTWQLSAISEALGGLQLTVTDSLSVGRGSDNDVVLGSKEVSRNHAILSVLNDKLYVKDLDSSNGTFINDQRIESNKSKYLKPEDTISFASFGFHVNKLQDAEPTPILVAPEDSDIIEPSEILDADVLPTDLAADNTQAPTNILEPEVIEAIPLHDHDNNSHEQMPVTTDTTAEPLEVVVKNEDRVDILEVRSAAEDATQPNGTEDHIESATLEDSIPDPLEEGIADTQPVAESAQKDIMNDYDKQLNDVSQVHPASSDSAELEDSLPDPLQEGSVADSTPAIADQAPVQEQPFKDDHLVKSLKPKLDEDELLTSNAPAPSVNLETPSSAQTPVVEESLISDPVLEAPMIAEPDAAPIVPENMSQSAQLASDHDKTTTTPLQEEADPDILRAKQAATGQFTGTANLGAPRDVGTQGNNALDQALNNPANTDHLETKKPSGSWFIWVFIVIIIIGAAIWLFNMGGM